MNLAELLDGLVDDSLKLDKTIEIKGVALDSRKVKAGFVFIAVAGAIEHGLLYLHQAIENGASAVIYEPQGSEPYSLEQLSICHLAVADLSLKLGCIANRFYQAPSKNLDVIGVTGTNGKTSCSQFLLQLLPDCSVIGTLGWGQKKALKQTLNTTPDAVAVQRMLAEFVSMKKKTVVMEVSSHGLQQGRVNEVSFKGAVFTNLSRDHLDYHGSMEDYLQAKLILFKQPELQFVVVNADDVNSEMFLAVTHEKVKRWTFSTTGNESRLLGNTATENVIADDITYSLNGIKFVACWRNERVWVQTRIVGDFNLENILAVMTVMLAQGYSLNEVAIKVSELVPISGRMERFGGNGKPVVFIDYAHTPDALEKVLQGLRRYCQHDLRVVFGCGGNRDKGKRAQMGAIAENFADQVIITNDNPRLESPIQIINDIVAGCTNEIEIIQNRELAIQTAIRNADNNDCVVIAGKGHEEYQEVNGVRQAFSDQAVVRRTLQEWTEQV